MMEEMVAKLVQPLDHCRSDRFHEVIVPPGGLDGCDRGVRSKWSEE